MVKFARVSRTFHFDSGHYLPDYEGKCKEQHGHRWELTVVLEGRIQDDGMVADFSKIREIVHTTVISRLDHTNINNLLPNPTAELICVWIWVELNYSWVALRKAQLVEIRLKETPDTEVIYRGGLNG